MTRNTTRIFLLALMTSSAIPHFATAQETTEADAPAAENQQDEAERVEDTIIVTGNRQYLYREESTDALGLDIPLFELPATVNIVTEDFLEDVRAFDINDVLTFVPGVQPNGAQAAASQDFVIRGFESDSQYINGLRISGLQQVTPSTDNLARLEIVKGPAGAEFGIADAGGAINYVTLKPESKFSGRVFAGAGDYGYRRVGGDITGPIVEDGSLRYRLISTYTERAQWRAGRPDPTRRIVFSPSIAWDYLPGGTVIAEYEYLDSNETLDRGIFYLEGAGFEDNFAARDWDRGFDSDQANAISERLDLTVDQRLTDHLSLELRYQSVEEARDEFSVANLFNNIYQADGLTWSGETEVGLRAIDAQNYGLDAENFSASLLGRLQTGGVEHSLRVGYQISENDYEFRTGQDGVPGGRIISNTMNIFEADNSQTYEFSGRGTFELFETFQDSTSTFAQYTADFDGKGRLLVGLRNDDVEFANGAAYEEVSVRVAGSYALAENISLFAGYSDSYSAQTGTTPSGDPIEPLHNIAYEGGVKFELFDGRVLWTNSLYQTTRDNIAFADPDDLTGQFVIPFGEVRVRGIESEFVGTIGDDLDVSAGLAFQDTENVETDDPSVEGNEFINVPNVQASLFANYRLSQFGLDNLSARAGVLFVGAKQGNAANTFEIPEWSRIDIGARYNFTESTSVDVFVENLFDETYYQGSRGLPTNILPGDRRLIQVNLLHSF